MQALQIMQMHSTNGLDTAAEASPASSTSSFFCPLLLLFVCLMAQHACSMGREHNFRTPQEQTLRSLAAAAVAVAAASHQSWFEHK